MVLDGPFSSTITAISDDFSPVHPSLPSLCPSTRMAFEPGKASLDLMHPMVHLKMQLQNSVQRHVWVPWKWFPRSLQCCCFSPAAAALSKGQNVSWSASLLLEKSVKTVFHINEIHSLPFSASSEESWICYRSS